jgi:hexokinase
MRANAVTERLAGLRLVLGDADLKGVRDALVERARAGMLRDGAEIAMLPAWLAPPARGLTGEAIAVDAGGTNLRAARVRLAPGRAPELVSEVASAPLPGAAGSPAASRPEFFAAHAEVLEACGVGRGTPVGYCFSYPIQSRPDGDAVLLRWTKEVRVADVVGVPVGRALRDGVASEGLDLGPVVVLNDTIATLLGGSLGPGADAARAVGLIVGTGTNLGAFLRGSELVKLGDAARDWARMAVNFESGAYDVPGLGLVDAVVDEASLNPGAQRFEKAVSGAYLGRLFTAAAPEFDVRLAEPVDSAYVSTLAAGHRRSAAARLARALVERSADLVAAALAASHELVGAGGPLYVCAEGTLFWQGPGYAKRVAATLDRLLAGRGPGVRGFVTRSDHANLVGSAVAALSHARV